MVARGDLVELPAHTFSSKELIRKAKMARTSYCCYPNDGEMITSLTPTRAEVNDELCNGWC
jgi:pyruvate kinase